MTRDYSFKLWCELNPPPCLTALVEQFGGYDKVPGEAWDAFAADYAQWEFRRRSELLGSASWAIPLPKAEKRRRKS